MIDQIDFPLKNPPSCVCLACLMLAALHRRLLNSKPVCVHPKSCLIESSTADEIGLVLDLEA